MTLVEEYRKRYEEEKQVRREKLEEERAKKNMVAEEWVEIIKNAIREKIDKALNEKTKSTLPSRFAVEVSFFAEEQSICMRLNEKTYNSGLYYLSKDEMLKSIDDVIRKEEIKKEGKDGTNVILYYVAFD